MNLLGRGGGRAKWLQLVALVAILFISLTHRLSLLDQRGGDFPVYRGSAEELLRRENPYQHTVESFQTPGTKHWYAYLPLWLYSNTSSYLFSSRVPFLDFEQAMKIPVLIGDLGLALLLYAILVRVSPFAAFVGVAGWLFNPHILVTNNYTHFDPLPSLFVLLSLYALNRSGVVASLSLAAAVGFKQYAILLVPYYLISMEAKRAFILSFGGALLLISLPFLLWDSASFVYSTVIAHLTRGFGGRSVLGMVNELLGLSIPSTVGLLLIGALYAWLLLGKRAIGKYAFATLAIGIVLVFSPVLHRTYGLWLLPVYFAWAGIFASTTERKNLVFALLVGGLYCLYWGYLAVY